jgi:hypothetical protein
MDWPRSPTVSQIGSHSAQSPIAALALLTTTWTAAAAFDWPAANQAIFVPLAVPVWQRWSYGFWINGSTITSSNVDVGIYSIDGVRLASTGSVVMAGATNYQSSTLLSTVELPPGPYYLAMSCNNTTARGWGVSTPSVTEGRMAGLLQMASAFPLPATATFSQWASTGYPYFGIANF